MIAALKATEPRMKHAGVAGLSLFGSFARDEAGDDSDVDVFIGKADPMRFGFEDFMEFSGMVQDAYRPPSSASATFFVMNTRRSIP